MFLFSSGTLYYQAELNKIWDHYGNPPEGSPIPIAPGQQQAVGYPPQAYLPPGELEGNPHRQGAYQQGGDQRQDGDQQRGSDPGREPAP
jgi:hypothetical protein